ncbi:MAG: aromatic amino acid hydroxylase [Pseudomonadota bacterium]
MKSQQDVIASLPVHLQPFVAIQDYSRYTPRDQAVWRFLLYQLIENLSETAHPLYLEGLKRTGIDKEYIPKIEEMNLQLEKIGWRAAVVDGFVPPAIFIEFLAHRVLVIAVDIRSVQHMLYTPAPDIIHESAGHAPFIIDVDYAEYLERVGNFGRRVITNIGDLEIYEAIRTLSIIKESPTASVDDIDAAETSLRTVIDKYKNDAPSESALLSRLQWWTTEYGLVGTPDDYKIFGAGLLSSLGESVHCLDDDKVKKIPLTIDAIAIDYDITNEQPQLFVARNCRHLSQIAEEFAHNMCFAKGGALSLEVAMVAKTVNTAVFNSGLEVSAVIESVQKNAAGKVIYFTTTGPTQLAYEENEIVSHGINAHPSGFASPVGKIQAMDRCLSTYSIDDLKLFGIVLGKRVKLEFLSGITVDGKLFNIYRRHGKNLLMQFDNCTVTTLDKHVLFSPENGRYNMAVGEHIVSVYGGSADQARFPLYKNAHDQSQSESIKGVEISVDDSEHTVELFSLYAELRSLRQCKENCADEVDRFIERVLETTHNEWLLTFELLELSLIKNGAIHLRAQLFEMLHANKKHASPDDKTLIDYGLHRLSTIEKHKENMNE